ncbi:MAG: hypothetical protein FWD83_08000, partial [Promicromonosporaceae bacterium]|nr:hypothetical protein [Promicromonosporaceae bacterium]
ASSILTADAAYAVLEHVEQAAPAWALSLRGLGADRELLESILTAMLREALGGADADETLAINPAEGLQAKHLGSVWYRAQLARRFHNEAVAQALHARRHWYVRLFRLAGRAPLPQTVELDDQMPPTLTTPSGG